MKVAIVGGGVFGVAAALALARRGHDVALHEAGEIPSEHAASRDVSKLFRLAYGAETARWAPRVRDAMEHWRAVQADAGERFLHDSPFHAASSSFAPGSFERESADALAALGSAHEVLEGRDLARAAPALAALGAAGVLVDREAGWFEPVSAVKALAAAAVRAGARLFDRSRVSPTDLPPADAVVVAAGGWLPRLGLAVPVRVTLQHEFFFPARGSGPSLPAWSYDIATEGFYGFPPLADGRHKVALHRLGPAIVDPAAKPEPTPAERDEVIRFARVRLPCLDASRVTWRSCQYAMSQDGAFLFAPAPDRPGVFVAGCGSGHAFKFGPLLGEWAADLVEGKPLPRDLRGAAAPGAKRVV